MYNKRRAASVGVIACLFLQLFADRARPICVQSRRKSSGLLPAGRKTPLRDVRFAARTPRGCRFTQRLAAPIPLLRPSHRDLHRWRHPRRKLRHAWRPIPSSWLPDAKRDASFVPNDPAPSAALPPFSSNFQAFLNRNSNRWDPVASVIGCRCPGGNE